MNIAVKEKPFLILKAEHQANNDSRRVIFNRANEFLSLQKNLQINDIEIIKLPKILLVFQAIFLQIFAISLLLTFSSFVSANESPYIELEQKPQWLQLASLIEEEKRSVNFSKHRKIHSSWAFAFDNDLLAPGHRDRDYTYGRNLTYSGITAIDAGISLKAPLAIIDRWLGLQQLTNNVQNNYSVETGLYGFTPKNITQEQINESDRPYASIIYLSSSHEQLNADNNVAWKTTLTLGVLGLGIAGELQNVAHEQVSGKEARGWNHQISNGGELTGRYTIARQHYLESFSDSLEMKSTLQASVGYLTETSWSLSLRSGKIISPWVTFNPDLITYGEKSTYSNNTSSSNEHYFWAGFTIKARFYNAFLQGQARDTDFSYSYDSLRPMILEGWAGYTYAFKQGYRISYVLRAQTSEIKQGDGNRNLVWGGLIFAKTI